MMTSAIYVNFPTPLLPPLDSHRTAIFPTVLGYLTSTVQTVPFNLRIRWI